MQVPSDKACLGHIIGPKGLFIVEMERSSQCTIKIEKEFVEGTNPAERKVSVSGSNMVQISQALDLVNTKVDEWRRNYTSGGAGSYRAPDEPKPYWDAPKAASGFGAYPNQYPPQYTPQGANASQPSYASGGAAQTYPNQSTGGVSQYPPSQGAVGQPQYAPAQGGLGNVSGGNMQMPGLSQGQGVNYYQGRQ